MTTPQTTTATSVRTWRPVGDLDVHLTLGQLQRGRSDPTYRVTADGAVWRTSRTPDGTCTLRILPRPSTGDVEATAWGDGAAWALDRLPELLGDGDDVTSFTPHHPIVRDAHRRHPGLRMPRTGLVMAALVPSILEQKVTTIEARQAYRQLVRDHGDAPPGPAPDGMRVAPTAHAWATVPSWEWHGAGVDHKRSTTIVRAARSAPGLERTAALANTEASRLMRTLPGIGVWTAAETMQRSHGDADAVSVGDLHLPKTIGHALAGHAVDDDGMLELLEPYRGHRHRAALLIRMSGVKVPRRAPRFAPRDYRRI